MTGETETINPRVESVGRGVYHSVSRLGLEPIDINLALLIAVALNAARNAQTDMKKEEVMERITDDLKLLLDQLWVSEEPIRMEVTVQ